MFFGRDPFDPAPDGTPPAPLSGRTPAPGLRAAGEPFATRSGQIASWQGARERGETGLVALAGTAAIALYELPAVPDFSSSRFPDLSGLDARERASRVGEAQSRLLTALHALGPAVGASLRYLARRDPASGEGRVRCFLVLRAFAEKEEEARTLLGHSEAALLAGLAPGYRLRRREPGEEPGLLDMVVMPRQVCEYAEVLRPEQAIPAWHRPDLCGFSFWYFPLGFSAAGEHDMLGFCRALCARAAAEGGAAFLADVTLVPTLPLTPVEREEVAAWLQLAERWGREQRLQLPGGLYSKGSNVEVAPDPHAQEAKKGLSDALARFGGPQSRAFLYAVRVLRLGPEPYPSVPAAGEGSAATLAGAFASAALAPGAGSRLVHLLPGHEAFDRAVRSVHLSYVTAAVCNEAFWSHPEAPETLRRLHRLAGVGEIAGFFRLPIPGRDGCPGMALDFGLPGAGDAARSAARDALRIGRFLEGGRITGEPATMRLPDLCKHALIVGTPGSGKTSLCFSLLSQLWREHRIPFLVLEPAKTEYRALAEVPGMEDLLVFTVGSERVSPFRLNPLEVPPGVPVAEHIAAVTACLAGAFSLPDPLPMLLDEALREVYADAGFSEYGVGGDDPELEPPTMEALLRAALAVAGRSRYQGEVGGNIRAALQARLGTLLRGPRGRCFGARRSVPVAALLSRPVVLELEPLSEDEKALAMMLLLVLVRGHARATRRSGAPLSHVVLVEEAHNLLGHADGPSRPEGGDPKATAVRYFVRILAEMRALGQGIVIADQLPTALAPEAIKSTNLKVMHRLTAADDREALGKAMTLTEGQTEQAATLTPGLSLIFQEGWAQSRLVQEPNVKEELGVAEPPEDDRVRERMQGFPETDEMVREAYLPYAGCAGVCARCDPRLRERVERWTARKLPRIEEACASRPVDAPDAVALIEYRDGLDAELAATGAGTAAQGCALVHFVERVLPAVLPAGAR